MTLQTRIKVDVGATLTTALDLATASAPVSLTRALTMLDGVAAREADRIWHDRRTIAASGTDDLDLAGALTDALGAAFTLARVRALLVAADKANTNNLVIGNATNALASLFGAGTHTLTVRPGGLFLVTAPDAAGYVVTAGTGDQLRIANSGAGTGVTYDIVVVGASA